MRLFRTNPRKLWRWSLRLTSLWFVAAFLLLIMILRLPIDCEAVSIPSCDGSNNSQSPVSNSPLQSYNCIWKKPLRQQLTEPKDPKPSKPHIQKQPVNLKLVGTAVEGNESYAFVQIASGGIKVVRIGSIVESYTIAGIEANRICISRDKVAKYLTLPEATRRMILKENFSKPAAARQQTILSEISFEKTPVSPSAEHIEPIRLINYSTEALLKDVRLIPCIETMGHQKGFRIDSISSGSSLLSCGLLPGDVIVSVDRKKLAKLIDMELLYLSLRDGQKHTWQIQRQNFNIDVEIN